MTKLVRTVPSITLLDAQRPDRLVQYLRELERTVLQLASEADKPQVLENDPIHLDFDVLRYQLSARGEYPLNVEGLPGVLSDAQIPGLVVSAVEPSVTAYPINTLLVQTGPPDTIKYLKAGTPNVWTTITATAATPANMMTTDTNQTPGATVVKTMTARQIFNGGLDAAAQIHVTAGGIDIDAGGLNVDAGTSKFAGRTDIAAELLLTGVSVIGVADSPFTVPAAKSVVLVNTSGGAVTINLTASAVTDRFLIIKDGTGNAAANTITVNGNGVNIDGVASKTINTAYGVLRLLVIGPDWGVI